MRHLNFIAVALFVSAMPGQVAFADHHEGDQADQKIYLDEEYDEERNWALGLGFGLVELGDNFVEGNTVVSDDDVEQYWMLNLRIPFGDRHAHGGGSGGGFRGYLEPELGYWEGDSASDFLVGLNIVGGMPFNAVEFFVGGGIGMHFIDSDVVVPGGDDTDNAVGLNAHFGVDVNVSESVSFFGVGRFDIIDDNRDELEGKAAVGLRLHF